MIHQTKHHCRIIGEKIISKKITMKYLTILATLLLFLSGCKDDCFEVVEHEYDLALEDGIYVEKFAQDVTDENRYNGNNKIYELCKKFIYDYYYEDTDGNQFLIEREKGNITLDDDEFQKWFFVPKDNQSKRTIVQLQTKVRSGLDPFIDNDPTYNQSIFKFYDIHKNGKSIERGETGLIENEMNVWTHPSRHGLFAMLEFAPFPYIQAPYEIGNSWVWDYVNINSDNWSDSRWLEFEGEINIISTYEITDIKMVDTKLGEIECYEITGTATNPYGEAKLVAYFNSEYGFVKLNYTNINLSKMVIELVEIEE